MQSYSTAQEPTETLTKSIPQHIPSVKQRSPTHKHHRKRQCALTVGGAVSALCPWHVPTHFGYVPRAPSRLGSGFMLSRLGDATPRTDQPHPCHSNTSPTSTFYNRHAYRHAEPTHSGLLRNKSALTTIADTEPTMRKSWLLRIVGSDSLPPLRAVINRYTCSDLSVNYLISDSDIRII